MQKSCQYVYSCQAQLYSIVTLCNKIRVISGLGRERFFSPLGKRRDAGLVARVPPRLWL